MNQEELKRILNYDPITGVFNWKIDVSLRIKKGHLAGSKNRVDGYVKIKYKGRVYAAARLAWLYVHGTYPPNEIDHINRIRDDNRIENLRCVTRQENLLNRGHAKGFTKKKDKFVAQIVRNGKKVYLGTFHTEEEAMNAFSMAKYKYEQGENL